MTAQSNLPGPFLRFIGVAETLGAIGLILPQLLHIRPVLMPIAAAGLVIIMIGAVVLSAPLGVGAALFPFGVGLLLALVAYSRWPAQPRSSHSTVLHSAA